jgi:DNA replication protein DnaC
VEPIKDILEQVKKEVPSRRQEPHYIKQSEMGEPVCPICGGVKFVHPLLPTGQPDYSRVVPCKCVWEQLKRERTARMLKMCELPVGTEHMTFENFNRRPGLEEAYSECLNFAEGRADFYSLTLWSDTGRGKTHLGIATVRQWLMRGIPARYAYVPLLLEELRRGFRAEGDMSYEARFDFYRNVPLLMLDDLGTENPTKWVNEKLDIIVDYRLNNNLYTLVTTNLTMDELNFRIASRLQRRGSKVIIIDAPEFV